MESTTDPSLTSWLDVPPGSDFPIQNLPYGVFRLGDRPPAVGVAIGDMVLDLAALHDGGMFRDTRAAGTNVFARDALNDFMALGKPAWTDARARISSLLLSGSATLRDHPTLRDEALIPARDVTMLLPARIGDFTDFYASRHHATNVGIMFRGKENALMPNWLHLPVGYHGRSGTVFVSGVDIHRPCGQTRADDADLPAFGPSRLLDFELEMGFFVGTGNAPGEPVSMRDAADRIFGMVLLNDWSARDIQKWEYVPLGPFLGKSFGTSISPWVVTLDALEPFRIPGPVQEPAVLDYLRGDSDGAYDIRLEAHLQSATMPEPMRLCSTNFRHLYWSIAQMLAHHTAGGTAMRPGDLCGTGTISGPTEDSYGCMLELCWKGTKPKLLPDGSERSFLADGDAVILTGHCQKPGLRIGFGEVRATILPPALGNGVWKGETKGGVAAGRESAGSNCTLGNGPPVVF